MSSNAGCLPIGRDSLNLTFESISQTLMYSHSVKNVDSTRYLNSLTAWKVVDSSSYSNSLISGNKVVSVNYYKRSIYLVQEVCISWVRKNVPQMSWSSCTLVYSCNLCVRLLDCSWAGNWVKKTSSNIKSNMRNIVEQTAEAQQILAQAFTMALWCAPMSPWAW